MGRRQVFRIHPIFNEQVNASETRTGWTVGGGIERAFWNNWPATVEYDFYDFGTRSVTLAGTFAGGAHNGSGCRRQTDNLCCQVRYQISVWMGALNHMAVRFS